MNLRAVERTAEPPAVKTRGRDRSVESEEAVLAAAAELLKEMPLRDISIEEIARRAGVGKTTIYRWWPTKAYVALDAFLKTMRRNVNVPNTGSAGQGHERAATLGHSFLLEPIRGDH